MTCILLIELFCFTSEHHLSTSKKNYQAHVFVFYNVRRYFGHSMLQFMIYVNKQQQKFIIFLRYNIDCFQQFFSKKSFIQFSKFSCLISFPFVFSLSLFLSA